MTPALDNVHPGGVLRAEFLTPLGLSQSGLARDLGVPPRRVNEIVHGQRRVTAETALRLARYFGTSEGFWTGLQADYDLEETRKRLGEQLERDVRPRAALLAHRGLTHISFSLILLSPAPFPAFPHAFPHGPFSSTN